MGANEQGSTETTDVVVSVGPGEAAPAPPAEPAKPSLPATLTLIPEGYGPLRIGMTLAEVTAAMGPDADPAAVGGADPEQCDQFRPARAPEGLLVMVEDGRLTRISLINDAKVETERGLVVGSAAEAVEAVYKTAAKSSPHKYVEAPARYITVWKKAAPAVENGPVSPEARGIVYEVGKDGRVEAIHAGGPSIQYVEGCA